MTNAKPSGDPMPDRGEAVCASPEETRALGGKFAAARGAGGVFSLEGPLGAGKTQFVKGFVAALGPGSEVSSPTFTLVHEYAGGTVAHFDWYRLEGETDVLGLGWDDYLASGAALLVEWGDKFPALLPTGAWRVEFVIEGAARRIRWAKIS